MRIKFAITLDIDKNKTPEDPGVDVVSTHEATTNTGFQPNREDEDNS